MSIIKHRAYQSLSQNLRSSTSHDIVSLVHEYGRRKVPSHKGSWRKLMSRLDSNRAFLNPSQFISCINVLATHQVPGIKRIISHAFIFAKSDNDELSNLSSLDKIRLLKCCLMAGCDTTQVVIPMLGRLLKKKNNIYFDPKNNSSHYALEYLIVTAQLLSNQHCQEVLINLQNTGPNLWKIQENLIETIDFLLKTFWDKDPNMVKKVKSMSVDIESISSRNNVNYYSTVPVEGVPEKEELKQSPKKEASYYNRHHKATENIKELCNFLYFTAKFLAVQTATNSSTPSLSLQTNNRRLDMLQRLCRSLSFVEADLTDLCLARTAADTMHMPDGIKETLEQRLSVTFENVTNLPFQLLEWIQTAQVWGEVYNPLLEKAFAVLASNIDGLPIVHRHRAHGCLKSLVLAQNLQYRQNNGFLSQLLRSGALAGPGRYCTSWTKKRSTINECRY